MSRGAAEIPSGRLIAMGSAALMEGFALLGFETHPDATVDELDELLARLLDDGSRALILLEPDLARCDCPALLRARAESARLVVTEIPPLDAPQDYHPQVEDVVVSVLGSGALEERP